MSKADCYTERRAYPATVKINYHTYRIGCYATLERARLARKIFRHWINIGHDPDKIPTYVTNKFRYLT